MGYTTRPGTEITDFQPDDTAECMYINQDCGSTITYQNLLEKIQAKWGSDVSLEDVRVGTEHIHTHCLYYDRYDSSDYTNFLVVTLDT